MAIQANFPAIKPSLNLDFSNTKKLDSRITFTRASTATYYDGVTTAKAEENLLLRSQDFDIVGVWPTQNATVTANTEVAPDGTTTAETLTDDATSSQHRIEQVLTGFAAGTTYTASCFIKKGTNNFAALTVTDAATAQQYFAADFDLDSGVVRISGAGTSGTLTSSSIASVGNGWFRCVITGQIAVVGTMRLRIALSDGASALTTFGGISYVGTGSTIYVWGAQLEQRSSVTSYTATTTQAITNYIPVLLSATNNVPRFDHNPTTGESLGLLIEEQRTNLLLQSEDLDTTWAETRATLNLNSVVSPAGTLTADRLIASTDNDTHFTTQTFTGTAASYTFTVYAKASGLNFVALRLFNGTSQVGLAYYNLSTGATGTVTAGTATITSVGNGWYRCSLTATLAASASCTADIYLASADNTNSFAGDAFNGIALWGFQTELGAFPTSYIATVAATATRSADAASMTGTNFSSWFNPSEGTTLSSFDVIGYNPAAASSFPRIFSIDDGTSSNRMYIASTNTGGSLYPFGIITRLATAQAEFYITAALFTSNVKRTAALAYKVNDSNFVAETIAGTTDTSCLIPGVNQITFGSALGVTFLNGHIRRIAYYPLRLTNAQLQALTG